MTKGAHLFDRRLSFLRLGILCTFFWPLRSPPPFEVIAAEQAPTWMKLEPECKRFIQRLASKLRKLRTQRNWTLEDTEEHGWPAWRHLQKIEAGKNITVATLWRLGKLYKVSLSDLLRGL